MLSRESCWSGAHFVNLNLLLLHGNVHSSDLSLAASVTVICFSGMSFFTRISISHLCLSSWVHSECLVTPYSEPEIFCWVCFLYAGNIIVDVNVNVMYPVKLDNCCILESLDLTGDQTWIDNNIKLILPRTTLCQYVWNKNILNNG